MSFFRVVRTMLRCLCVAWPALALAGCSAADALNFIVPGDGYTKHASTYGSNPRQGLDVYEPKTAAPPGGRTVVVFFYGGSWAGGQKSTYRFVAEALTAQGYLAVLPDYRVHPEAVYPAFVEDAATALKWTVENAARYGGNPDKIVLMGHSAGAHIAALLALDPQFLEAVNLPRETIKGFVGLAGPYSFAPLEFRVTRAVFGHLKDPNIVRPVIYAANPAPPMLLLHGADDTTVGPYNSVDLTAALIAAGQNVTHIVYPDVAHVGIILAMAKPFRGRAPTLSDTAGFIDGLFQNKAASN
ncbi:MAG: alpha/beta hydrolase [Rhodospirillaceae bacterium]|nr:alpha/beta hydrolase [Rhodospirillaceae bacterium]